MFICKNPYAKYERPRFFGRDGAQKPEVTSAALAENLKFSAIPADPAGGHCYGSATKTCKS